MKNFFAGKNTALAGEGDVPAAAPLRALPSDRKSSDRGRRATTVLLAGMVVAGTLVAGGGAAQAAEWYDAAALLTSCTTNVNGLGKADKCRFEPTSRQVFTGSARQVGPTFHACRTPFTIGRQSTETHSEENSIGVSATVEAGLSNIFSASITASYGYAWGYSMSETVEVGAELPAYSIGYVTVAPAYQRVTGRMVINYPKRRYGHFEWYAYPTLTQFDPAEPQYQTVTVITRPMTAAELRGNCGVDQGTNSVKTKAAVKRVIKKARAGYKQGAPRR